MKVVFCGSRNWTDDLAIYRALMTLPNGTTIITGGAKGADSIAHLIAWEQIRFNTKVMVPDWELYGKRAGFLRNIAMLDENPAAVWAFWDGNSKGTKHTIDEAIKRNIDLNIIFPKGD